MSVIVLPILLTLAANIAAAVVPLSNGNHQTGLFYNFTEAPKLGVIDPRFTTTYRLGEDRLSDTSCLMNAVNAMMELALENFTERIDLRNYVDPGYPEVEIVPLTLAAGRRVEARYLLWGVWEGIRWMIHNQIFQDLVVGARWNGILMCRIWFKSASRRLSIAGSNDTVDLTARAEKTSIYNATAGSSSGLSVMDVRNPLNDQHVTVAVTQIGDMLRITEVFITIFAALEYMAHFPSTDEVARFRISPDDEDTTIGILEHTRAHPARPPFLDYQWVILGLGQIPGYMLQQRRFTEVVIEIAVDGVPLGEGFISK